MTSERLRFKESLKEACKITNSTNKNMIYASTSRVTESPEPYFTDEERQFWANNNVFEDSGSENVENTINPGFQLHTNREADNKNEESNEASTNGYKINGDQHKNISLLVEDHNLSVIGNNDPLLSSNNGPDSCIATLINLDLASPSPSLSSNNTPAPCIGTLLDDDGINSIPPSPLDIATNADISLTPLNTTAINIARRTRIIDHKNQKDKGKGRSLHKDQWKDVKRKLNKNTGKCYYSRNGVERPARNMKPFCNKCRFFCPKKFSEQLRNQIFKNFWSLGNVTRQWDFISKYCHKIPKRRRTKETPSRRQNTITYSLPAADFSDDTVPVCKIMFLNTLGIGTGMISTALKKNEDGKGFITPDARGGRNNRPLIIDTEMIKSVCEHVNSFQPVESHYVRSRTSKLYLDESLSYSRMFVLYKEWILERDSSNPARTLRQYRDIVNSNFNLGFHVPRKDQCDVCHVYKYLPKPVPETEFKTYSDHIRNKDIARELKKKYKELSIKDCDKTLTTTFDFQKIHGIPHAETSILYYKRKLSVYNLTFYSLGQKEGTCYVWDETVAKKGATEVASCVYRYISEHSQKGIVNFIFFSDNFGGQNRNRVVFLAYLHAAKNFGVTITHIFLERGHTQNEGDSVHALIERFAKNKNIYIPDDWYNLIRWAKQDNKPYRVIEMQNSEFLDFKKFFLGANWVTNEKGEKMFWSHIRQLHILPNETEKIYYKTDFCSHEYDCMLLYNHRQLNSRRRRKDILINDDNSISKAYLNKFAVPKNKFQDLKYLCDHHIIPAKYHGFYQSLISGDDDETELNVDI